MLLCSLVAWTYDFTVGKISYIISSIDDLTVEVAEDWDRYHSYSGIVIPERVKYNGKLFTVTSIGEYAFEGCFDLTSATIPNSVTSIGEYAFSGCQSLTSITIPSSITSIGTGAFCKCKGLNSINVDNNNKYYVSIDGILFTKDKTTILCYPAKITDTTYVIPNSVKTIGYYAFDYCSNLTLITIPNSVTSIGGGAFFHCSGFTSVTIPNSVTSIGYSAFQGCSGLTSVTIGNSVTSIGGWAFEGCSDLTSITIPNSVTSIGEYAFNNTAWYENLPDGIIYMGKVLYKYKGKMPDNTIVEIKDGTVGIGGAAFADCCHLASIIIPNTVTNIGDNAFSYCTGLTTLAIPNSLTKIGDCCFYLCSNLSVIKVDERNIIYDSRNNCNAIIETSTNTIILGCKNTVIPNSVTSIQYCSFAGCSGLTSVAIPNSVTSIGEEAFRGCSGLTSVTIPNSVTSIGNYAFNGCSGLTFVTIGNGVTSIGEDAFSGCSDLTSVTIPNSITNIGDYAFSGCSSLTEVISLIEEPFKIYSSVFYEPYIATLYVPVGTKEKYEATAAWNEFTNIVERGIAPEDNGDVNYGDDEEVNGDTDLSGTVVGNVFYSIADGNGSYSSTEGCIVVKKPTTDEQVSQVEGTDLFGEQMKDNFTGIIFKIEPGSGTVKVTAETTGDMTLKIKIGDGAPMEFKLNGMMEAKLPYTVDAPTYVYIYAGSAEASGAKGARKAAGNGELKIYGISWGDGSTDGIGIIDNGQLTIDNSPIYNLNGQRVESLQKGINIVNGKKILVQ